MTEQERQAYLDSLEMVPEDSSTPSPSQSFTEADRLAYLQELEGSISTDEEQSESAQQPDSQVGLLGKVPLSQYQAGERNIAGNLFERPAAAMRGGLQGLAPGGPSPLQAYQEGAVNPGSIPTFQQLALDAYYRDMERRSPGQAPTFPQTLGGLVPSAAGLAADVVTNPADMILSLTGALPPVQRGAQALAQTKSGQAIGRLLEKEISFRRPPQGLALTEKQVAQMPPALRNRYFEVQRMREEQRLGRQIGHFEEKARLRQAEVLARQDIGAKAITQQQVFGKVEAEAVRDATLSKLSAQEQAQIASLDTERETLTSLLNETAKQKTVIARQPFFDTAKRHSTEYKRLSRQAIASPEAQRASFTNKELFDLIDETFPDDLVSSRLAQNTLSLLDDPVAPQRTVPFSPQEILNEIDALGLQRGIHRTRVYTHRELVADKLRSALLDKLEQKGVDIRAAKEYWRPWAQTRDRAIKLLRPFDDERFPSYSGARALEQVARGLGPQEVVREIERELGVNLTDDLRQMVGNLQANERARLLAKVSVEAQREEANLTASRSLSDFAERAARQTERLTSVTSRKLASIQSETQAFRTMAETSSGRKLTQLERLQRESIKQATRQERAQRILRRSLLGLAAYGGLRQVPVVKDVLP